MRWSGAWQINADEDPRRRLPCRIVRRANLRERRRSGVSFPARCVRGRRIRSPGNRGDGTAQRRGEYLRRVAWRRREIVVPRLYKPPSSFSPSEISRFSEAGHLIAFGQSTGTCDDRPGVSTNPSVLTSTNRPRVSRIRNQRFCSGSSGLAAQGVTSLLITHKLDEVFDLADSATVLRNGNVAATFERNEFNRDVIVTAMIGRRLENLFPPRESSALTDEAFAH